MLGVAASLLIQVSLVASTADTYTVAHQRTVETGEPLVVLIGADWCPACQTMKTDIIPQAQRRGLLRRVAFAVVNTDYEPTVARQLMRGESIPQLVMYRKTSEGWKRRHLTGAQSLDALSTFLNTPSTEESPRVSRSNDASVVE